MHKKILIVAVVLIGTVGVFMAVSDSKKSVPPASNSLAPSIQTIKDEIGKGGQLIDVRTAAEYADGHISGAINLSLQDIEQGVMPEVAKDKSIYVYCRSGNRSSQAAAALRAAGYQKVYDLGAIGDVQSIGGVIEP